MTKLSKIIIANALGIISLFGFSFQVQAQSLGHDEYDGGPQMSWNDYQTGTITNPNFSETGNITVNSATGDSVTGELILNSQTIPESSPINGLILLGCIGASLSLLKSRKNMKIRDK